jgi:DNA internalization-related competence protein ComEC/Rec2
MKRPLFICVLFFILGIVLSQLTNFIFAVGIIFSALIFIYYKYGIKSMLLFFVIFFCGVGRTQFSKTLLPDEFINKNIIVTGIVKNVGPIRNYHRAIVKTLNFETGDGNSIEKSFNIQVYFSDDKEQLANMGEKITMSGKLLLPSKKRNPGGFDEENYFRTHLLFYKMFPNKIENGQIENHLLYHLEQFRNNLGDVYDTIFQSKEASIIKSMIIGDKSDLDDYTSELYKTAGIYHILAISGLHISIVALAFNFLLRFLCSQKTSGFISILLLILYCIMTGSSVSTVRAVIMASIIIIGDIIYRERDLITSLSFAALILLMYNPFYIFDVGFEYSFGAVFGIATCNFAIQRGFSLAALKIPELNLFLKNRFVEKYFSASIAASLFTFVVTLYYFYYFTPYSIFVNLFVLPNISLVVILGFAVGIIGLFCIEASSFLSAPIFLLLRFYEKVSQIFIALPFSKILVGYVNFAFIIFYLVWIFLLIFMLSSFNEKFTSAKKYFACYSIFFAFCIVIAIFFPKASEIVMLDVGQGDCFVVNSGQTFIIDGGGKRTQDIGNNTGVNILVPYLDYKAKNYVDAVFVSHSDADHIIGIIELLSKKNVGQIFLSEKISDDDLSQKLILEAEKFSVPIYYLKSGDDLKFNKADFYCLYPFENTKAENNNDTSLVLKLNLEGKDILFTGDIEKNAEQEILLSNENISADILKLAHHGSKTSSTLEFLKKVNPSLAIVSSGVNNSYGHPSKEIVQRLQDLNIPLINTAQSGAVAIKFLGSDKIKIIAQIN